MVQQITAVFAAVLLACVVSGCRTDREGTKDPVAAHAPTSAWVKSELYFGMSRPGGGEISGDEWGVFLAQEITPRFPDGLTVVDAQGQWREKSGTVVREKTKLIVLLYKDEPVRERAIDEIVRLFKERFRQEAVLRVRQRAEVSF